MKRLILISLAALGLSLRLSAQGSMNEILTQIEENNLTLQSLSRELEALGELNLSESSLDALEIEFAYLFGEDSRQRYDFGVSQSFDFANLFGTRRNFALGKNELLSLQYRVERREILNSARQLVARIIYGNALVKEYALRVEHAQEIEQAYKTGYEKGEFSIIDYRKAGVFLSEAQSQLRLKTIERDACVAELIKLNGGRELEIIDKEQEFVLLPGNFEDWLDLASESSSILNYVKTETSVSKQELKLNRNELLPTLSIGYTSEIVPGEAFRGVSLGLGIPLWSAGKKISSAKKRVEAAEIAEREALIKFRTDAQALYNKVMQLSEAFGQKEFGDTKQALEDLRKALDGGQLSLLEYINELSYFYSSRELALETELEYALSLSELLALEM